MQITAGPIAALKDLLWPPEFDIDINSLPWNDDPHNKSLFYFNRGMWAMREGIRLLLKGRGKTAGYVWFPDYFCNEALTPLRACSLKISFYPVKKDLTPDWESMESIVTSGDKPDIFVLVHYFGFPNQTGEAEQFCGKYDIAILEDAAHVLVPVSDIGSNNVTVYSPRKLLPIPEGGLLVVPGGEGELIEKGTEMDTLFCLVWIIRSLLKAIIVNLGIPWHGAKSITKTVSGAGADQLSDNKSRGRCGSYALRLLLAAKKKKDVIVEARRRNYNDLSRLLGEVRGIEIPFPSLPADGCPFTFPVYISGNQKVVIKRLNERYRVPASDWPDLPPEIINSKQGHETAVWMKDHIVLLPVHQGLAQRHIKYIADSLKEIMEEG